MTELLPTRSWLRRVKWSATAVGLVLLGASAALAATRFAERGFGNALVIPVGAVTAIAILLLGLGLYRLIGAHRDKAVWDRTRAEDGLVFSSGTTRGLREILIPYFGGRESEPLGFDFTVSCTVGGVTVWAGPAREPVALAVIPWPDIAQIAPGRVSIDTRSSRGLHLTLVSQHRLELQPLGEGVLGTFPFSTTSLRRLSARLEAMRRLWT